MSLGSHQRSIGKSQVHLTPRWIIEALGHFDLDPCAADPRPWDCAARNLTASDDGLLHDWVGRVWLNPPFDRREVVRWVERLSLHGDGIALLHARTETAWFRPLWARADAILFLDRRLTFCRPDGTENIANSGAPPVLAAFGARNYTALKNSKIAGNLVTRWEAQAA